MDFWQFISENARVILGLVGGAIVVIVIIAMVDRHPSQKTSEPQKPEPRDDE